jgi:hypothetical protein
VGAPAGIFQEESPVKGCWISADGNYAFVDFKDSKEATEAFVLQQVEI